MSKNALVKNNEGHNLGSNTQHFTCGGGLNKDIHHKTEISNFQAKDQCA